MNKADRAVRVLGLAAGPSRRARFVEEWQADLAAARSIGLSPIEILTAAARVAGFLFWVRVRGQVLRRREGAGPMMSGVLLGFVFAVTDVRLGELLPFVLLVLACRGWMALRRWIDGAR